MKLPRWLPRWKTVRRVWIITGLTATVLFNGWMLASSRARGFDESILQSDGRVTVREEGPYLDFKPNGETKGAGLVFYPGSGIDPKAYAPLARSIAEQGHEAVIVKLPMRLAPFEFQKEEAVERGRSWIESHPGRWVASGHSLGGVIASRLAAAHGDLLAGLVLIGTSHPVVLDLSTATYPVTKVYGTNDGVAPVEKIEATRNCLPPHTRWVRIEGGNHGQFGWYGRQFRDRPATISREEQQARTLEALLDVLR